MSLYSRALLSGAMLMALAGGAGAALAAPAAIAGYGPSGGELTPAAPANTVEELESTDAGQPAAQAQKAVTFRNCVAPFKVVVHRVTLPAFNSYLHRVVPDRSGFNVVMTIEYPGLVRRINNWGPGRAEAFTVRTPNGRVTGKVKISGVSGSYGCYSLRITP